MTVFSAPAAAGRLTAVLAEAFCCPVVGVEPSDVMLAITMAQSLSQVEWKADSAENVPLEGQAVDLVFMFHHLVRPAEALREIRRVLVPVGYLVIRAFSCENDRQNE